MEVIVKDPSGIWAQRLRKKQFAVVRAHIIECMNAGKRIKDSDVLDMLAQAGKPVEFMSSILMDVALYDERPTQPFLGIWFRMEFGGSQLLYNAVRDVLDNKDYANFDMSSDEETQRTFLFLVAYSLGARIPN